jgi:hypothetical protein
MDPTAILADKIEPSFPGPIASVIILIALGVALVAVGVGFGWWLRGFQVDIQQAEARRHARKLLADLREPEEPSEPALLPPYEDHAGQGNYQSRPRRAAHRAHDDQWDT